MKALTAVGIASRSCSRLCKRKPTLNCAPTSALTWQAPQPLPLLSPSQAAR